MTARTEAKPATHTPGPWKIERPFRASHYISMAVFSPDGGHIAEVTAQPDQIGPEANARLIAAAPELAEALEAAFITLGRLGGNQVETVARPAWEQARAALAKAGL